MPYYLKVKMKVTQSCPEVWGFPGDSVGKESTYSAGDLGLIPGLGRSPGEGNSYPLQYWGLENSVDRGAWQVIVHGAAKSWTRLGDFHFHIIWDYFDYF